MEPINLFGASGHAKVIIDILGLNRIPIGVLYDDSPRYRVLMGHKVFSTQQCNPKGPLIVSIGSNRFRRQITERYPMSFYTAVHPQAVIAQSAQIGDGTVIMAGAVVEAESEIAAHCIINTCASVNHECYIGAYSHISPNATLCGNVVVGEGSWIGAGATIIPGIKIGRWCIIGAGSVVLNDIPDFAVAVGNPARIIRYDRN